MFNFEDTQAGRELDMGDPLPSCACRAIRASSTFAPALRSVRILYEQG